MIAGFITCHDAAWFAFDMDDNYAKTPRNNCGTSAFDRCDFFCLCLDNLVVVVLHRRASWFDAKGVSQRLAV